MRSRNVKSLPSGTVAHGIRRSELPPLHLLYTFEAAARTLSFTAAGGELFLTQSAVSRQIQQVEEVLGAPLFERRHRALVLTEAGTVMQRAVVDCLARLRQGPALFARQPSGEIKALVGCFEGMRTQALPARPLIPVHRPACDQVHRFPLWPRQCRL